MSGRSLRFCWRGVRGVIVLCGEFEKVMDIAGLMKVEAAVGGNKCSREEVCDAVVEEEDEAPEEEGVSTKSMFLERCVFLVMGLKQRQVLPGRSYRTKMHFWILEESLPRLLAGIGQISVTKNAKMRDIRFATRIQLFRSRMGRGLIR